MTRKPAGKSSSRFFFPSIPRPSMRFLPRYRIYFHAHIHVITALNFLYLYLFPPFSFHRRYFPPFFPHSFQLLLSHWWIILRNKTATLPYSTLTPSIASLNPFLLVNILPIYRSMRCYIEKSETCINFPSSMYAK